MDVLTYWVINNLYIYLCKNFLNMLQSVTSFSGVISVGAVCSGTASYFNVSSGRLTSMFVFFLSAEIEKVLANIYSMKRTAIWKYVNRTIPSCWEKPRRKFLQISTL
jgi:hypothetical protein